MTAEMVCFFALGAVKCLTTKRMDVMELALSYSGTIILKYLEIIQIPQFKKPSRAECPWGRFISSSV